jgi:hypothetical protein
MDQDQKTRLWTIHMEPMLAARNRPSADIIVHISIGAPDCRTNAWTMNHWGRAEVFSSCSVVMIRCILAGH